MESMMQESGSKFIYNIVKAQAECEETSDLAVYGIQICGNGESSQIADISSDKQKVENLLHLLKTHEIRPEYLHEYVEDFLGEHYCDLILAKRADSFSIN